MDIFEKALASKRSTIIHGHYGRYLSLVQFYLNSISELEPISDYELIFLYRPNLYDSRLLHILIEPPFDAIIPSNVWAIVLTSHLHLYFNPLTTRVVKCEKNLNVPKPIEASADQTVLIPSTSHIWPFQQTIEEARIDLSEIQDCHEAYLKLLTVFDLLRPSSKWSLSIGYNLRTSLMKKLMPKSSKYDAQLLEVLR